MRWGHVSLVESVLFWFILGFLFGSLPFSVWLGHLIGGVDIRRYGDGNPGATNAWRGAGWRAGIPAMVLDYLKGVAPVTLAHYWAGIDYWPLAAVALAPVLGHAFSPFLRFRGGKALATTFGIWTGLTVWVGPTTLGVTFALAMAMISADAWSVMLGMLALLLSLLLLQLSLPLLAIWAGNLIVLIWKHWHDLRAPVCLRPWLRDLIKKPN
jgi:glycerol-3-phosphate acyltransferase PlsY